MDNGIFYSCGRGAIKALLKFLCLNNDKKTVFLPSYFCFDVTTDILSTGINVQFYEDNPWVKTKSFPVGSITRDAIIIIVNYFGINAKPDISDLKEKGAIVVEDHSHDVWSEWAEQSVADYCVASLRKILPVPDGGVLWSPVQKKLPVPPRPVNSEIIASYNKLTGMLYKRMYLNNLIQDKNVFFKILKVGEVNTGLSKPSAPSPVLEKFLSTFPIDMWNKQRQENYWFLFEKLRDNKSIEILVPEIKSFFPFSFVLLTSDAMKREYLRKELIQNKIYPTILWSLEEVKDDIDDHSLDISRRMISIPCDGRYTKNDLNQVSDIITSILNPKELTIS